MQLIATRHYHDVDPTTRAEIELEDRMFRRDASSFVLMRAGERPQDPAEPLVYNLRGVYQWLRELPDQISPAVVIGGRGS